MSQYRTKQREALISYLRTVPGRHVTAGDICAHFAASGTPIGTATVYRQLEGLVDEGLVNKYIIDSGSPACFEFVGENVHIDGAACYHCKCEKCGKLIHLRCEELSGLGEHLSLRHGFSVNPMRTVFYGVCADCRRRSRRQDTL